MKFPELSCECFTRQLASAAPVPGGGGASALAGALGVALGGMVGSLTAGKKKYAAVQEDIIALQARASTLQADFLALVDKDAQAFEPLSRAYGLPTDTPEQQAEKTRVMEIALRTACGAPLEMMEKCCQAIQLHAEFAQKGAAIAISDVGVGAALCRAALAGAALNVFINTKTMGDATWAEDANRRANAMLDTYIPMADEIYRSVAKRLKTNKTVL